MNKLAPTLIEKIVMSIKHFHLKQLLIVFLAVFLIFTSTACNPPTTRAVGEGSYKERVGQNPNLYDTTQKPVGGMNQFNDTPANESRKSADARAERLIQSSKANLKNRVRNAEEYVENIKDAPPLDKQLKGFADNVGDRVEQLGEDVSAGTKRGVRNLKENTQDAGKAIERSVKDTVDDVNSVSVLDKSAQKQRGYYSSDRSGRSVDGNEMQSRGGYYSRRRSDRGMENMSNAREQVRDAGKAVRRAADDAADKVGERAAGVNKKYRAVHE